MVFFKKTMELMAFGLPTSCAKNSIPFHGTGWLLEISRSCMNFLIQGGGWGVFLYAFIIYLPTKVQDKTLGMVFGIVKKRIPY